MSSALTNTANDIARRYQHLDLSPSAASDIARRRARLGLSTVVPSTTPSSILQAFSTPDGSRVIVTLEVHEGKTFQFERGPGGNIERLLVVRNGKIVKSHRVQG